MTVPEFQSFLLPLLKLTADGNEHQISEAIKSLSSDFNLTDADKKEMLPSGRQPKLDNRVSWARTYLKKAGLLESTGRARFRITSRGLDVLKTNPAQLNVKFLRQYPEFLEFNMGEIEKGGSNQKLDRTPEELLEASYQELSQDLAQELLDRVKQCSPVFFERLVVKLLVEMGYGGSIKDAGQAVGQSGDGGIDGIIKEDKLG